MLAALDSNFMIYALGLIDDPRNQKAKKLLAQIDAQHILLPLQSVAEMTFWMIKRAKCDKEQATDLARDWCTAFRLQSTTAEVVNEAFKLVARHDFQVFDAIVMAAAAEASADMLLSEDMHDGFRWRGVTIINPFVDQPHPLLTALLTTS
jgi:predicted nucleic acid-binding protein